MDAVTRSRLLLVGALLIVGVLAAGAALVFDRVAFTHLDEAWDIAMESTRTDFILGASLTLDVAGGGVVASITVLCAGIALWIGQGWRQGCIVVLACALSAGCVQVLKHVVGRDRPLGMLVESDFGSFPSGHTANMATLAVVLFLLFPRVWVMLTGICAVVTMALSRTVLSVHWLSDTLAGAALGSAIALLVVGMLVPWLDRRASDPRQEPSPVNSDTQTG